MKIFGESIIEGDFVNSEPEGLVAIYESNGTISFGYRHNNKWQG